jgi:hypothetical protein
VRDSEVSRIGDGLASDFYSLVDWWACSEGSGVVNVGIVDPSPETADDYGQFVSAATGGWVSGEFLLVTRSGALVASQLDGQLKIHTAKLPDEEGVDDEHQAQLVVSRILQARSVDWDNLDEALYEAPRLDHSLELVVPDFAEVSDELLAFFALNPDYMHKLHWRKFEELLAEIFRRKGYVVTLGPGRGDGGTDLTLLRREDVGQLLVLVQAKCYSPHYPVDLQPVQALYGNVQARDASSGVLATTSRFLPSAKSFAESKPNRLFLAEPAEIQLWLRQALRL